MLFAIMMTDRPGGAETMVIRRFAPVVEPAPASSPVVEPAVER